MSTADLTIDQMVLQLQKQVVALDKLIAAEPQNTKRWKRLCKAYDAAHYALSILENIDGN